jgi:AcrR family transcriptional regulator
MIEVVAERGYQGVTVRDLSRLAGVSTRTFYSHFGNVEQCFASTYESLMQGALNKAAVKLEIPENSEAQLRTRIQSLMRSIASHPKAAQLTLVEIFAVASPMQGRLRHAIAPFERLLAESLAVHPSRLLAPPHLVAGIVAGVIRVARTTSLTGRAAELPALADEITDWMLALPGEDLLGLRTVAPLAQASSITRSAETRSSLTIGRAGVRANDCARIFNAAAKLAVAGGFASLTASRIRSEAGVTRKRFDECFANVKECFLGTIEALTASAATRAEQRAADVEVWERRVYREMSSLCAQVAHDSTLAQLAFIEIFAPGREGLLRREHLISAGADHLRATAPANKRPSALVSEASIAAAWNVSHAEIAAGRARQIPRIAPFLTYLVLAPVVGPSAALDAIRSEQDQSR